MIIPERQTIYQVLKSRKRGLGLEQVVELLGMKSDQIQPLHNRIEAMVRDGQLRHGKRDTYLVGRPSRCVSGIFVVFGRNVAVELNSPNEAYLEMPHRLIAGLVYGDKVEVHLLEAEAGREELPVAVEVVERDREIVGTLTEGGYVEPLHEIGLNKVHLAAGRSMVDIASGSVVVVRLIKPESRRETVAGEIVEVLGECHRAAMEVDIVLRAYNVPSRWPSEVLEQVEQCAPVPERNIAGREDLRGMGFVTIDGEDAKDFDDAIFFEKERDGWRLWVAIADVASYVGPGSALDEEAFGRGNSLYFPGRVVPMLPSALSENLCSLRPDEDRLALVCRINLSGDGGISDYTFMRAVIRSQARMTYTEVARFLQSGKGLQGRPPRVRGMLREAARAFGQLLAQRKARCALDFDTLEVQMLFDGQGMLRRIVPSERNDAHRLIEESMICANVCAARFLTGHNRGLLYRVHTGLKQDSVEDLKFFLRERGLTLRGESNRDITLLLEEIAGRDDAHAVQSVVLRSLSRALYQPDNSGHYGLALEHYAHFTSPIRRYPDLLVHRAIHTVLDKDSSADAHQAQRALKAVGEHCSMTEKRADDATRGIEKYFKCLYVKDRVGESFTGIVVGVTGFGLFIELDGVYVEGLLHISSLISDYYFFDSQGHRLVGESSGRVYRLGDRIKVVLASVAPEQRKVDLMLPEDGSKRSRHRPRHRRR